MRHSRLEEMEPRWWYYPLLATGPAIGAGLAAARFGPGGWSIILAALGGAGLGLAGVPLTFGRPSPHTRRAALTGAVLAMLLWYLSLGWSIAGAVAGALLTGLLWWAPLQRLRAVLRRRYPPRRNPVG